MTKLHGQRDGKHNGKHGSFYVKCGKLIDTEQRHDAKCREVEQQSGHS